MVAETPYLSGGRVSAVPRARSAAVSDELDALLFTPAESAGLLTDADAPPSGIRRGMPVLVRVMFALDLLMGVLYILSRRVRDHIGTPLVNFFDLNGETNLPSWYSATQLALIGALLIVFATAQLRRGARAAWSIMLGGVGFLFLSLDETTSIHENFGYWLDHLRNRRDTVFAQTGFWMLICAPLFLGGLALLGWGARRYLFGRRGVVVTLVVGAIVFVAAGAGVEMLSNFVQPHGFGARALVLLEECGEMIGGTIMLWGVCALMRSHGVRLLVTDEAPPRPPLSTRP